MKIGEVWNILGNFLLSSTNLKVIQSSRSSNYTYIDHTALWEESIKWRGTQMWMDEKLRKPIMVEEAITEYKEDIDPRIWKRGLLVIRMILFIVHGYLKTIEFFPETMGMS